MKSKCCQAEVVTKHGCDQDLGHGHGGKNCDCEKKGWAITFWNVCKKCKKPCDTYSATHEEKLAAVRQKVIEACQESAIEFTFASRDKWKTFNPRLEHVLRALDKKIGLWQWHPVHKPVTVIESLLRDYWQLDTDLSGQSEATIEFLYDVFYPNGKL